jgi:Concanavalin A-like lectin/glucanases superfamily
MTVYKKLLLLLLLAPLQAVSQSTTVSATVTDTDGFIWAGGHIQISFVPSPSWPSPNSYVWSGGNLQQNNLFNGTMDGTGALSISIPDNTSITPSGSQWKFEICPNATTGCASWTQAVSGASANLTSALSTVAIGPRFLITSVGYGYGTVEVFPVPRPGVFFYNTSPNASPTCNQWTGSAWVSCSGGPAANPASPSCSYQFNNNGVFGGNGYHCDASSFSGADMGVQVANAIAALPSQGGTVDATNFSCPSACHIGTANLIVPSNVKVIWPTGVITRGTISATGLSAQIFYSSYSTMIGQGKGVTLIEGPSDVVGVQQAPGTSATQYPKISDLTILSTGSVVKGHAAFQAGGPTPGIPFAAPTTAPNGMVIGNEGPDTNGWPGRVAQYAVYNYALTPTQIANHYTVGSSGTNYETTITGDTPLIYYPMKETSGTTAVDLIAGRNGTYTAGVTLGSLAGIPGDTSCSGVCTAPVFNGSTSYLGAPSFDYFPNTPYYTIELWVNTNSAPGVQKGLIANSAMGCIDWQANVGGMGCFSPAAIFTGLTGSFAANTWYQLVMTHNASGITVYLNGVAVPVGSDVTHGTFENLAVGGADFGTLMDSFGGCICYNKFIDVDSAGASIGIRTENSSGFSTAVNSNTWLKGNIGGPVGLLDSGTAIATYIDLDLENNTSSTGTILFAQTDALNPGTSCNVGDTVRPSGGDGTAVLTITSVSNGGAYGVSITNGGTTYVNTPHATTTTLTGTCSGLEVDIITQAYMVLAGSAHIINPYEEAGGGNYICNQGNYVSAQAFNSSVFDTFYGGTVGAASSMYCRGYGGSFGGPLNNFVLGPTAAPSSFGVAPRLEGSILGGYLSYHGQTFNTAQYDILLFQAFTSSAVSRNLWADGPAWSGDITGRLYGHSPWTVGESISTGGTSNTGRTTFAGLSTPSAPTVTTNCTGTCATSYTYAIVAYDYNGGFTSPSSFATVNGPASLSGTVYNTITFPWIDGAKCIGILKTDTTHVLPVNPFTGANTDCTPTFNGSNYFQGGQGTITVTDIGQTTQSVTLPARATTADMLSNGNPIAVTSTTAPTIGQAACIKAVNGVQVTLGYCSTTPTSGTCTCN